jgi:hypothetical protein
LGAFGIIASAAKDRLRKSLASAVVDRGPFLAPSWKERGRMT